MAKTDNIIYYQLRGKGNSFTPYIEKGKYNVNLKINLENILAK